MSGNIPLGPPLARMAPVSSCSRCPMLGSRGRKAKRPRCRPVDRDIECPIHYQIPDWCPLPTGELQDKFAKAYWG